MIAFLQSFFEFDTTLKNKVDVQTVLKKSNTYISSLPTIYKVFMRASFFYFQYAVFPFERKLLPFSLLSADGKQKYLETWAESRFFIKRMVYRGMVSCTLPFLFADPAFVEKIGYQKRS